MIRLCVEIFVKGILLFLVFQFGSNVTVKSFLYSTGELVIIGTDPEDKEVFKLLLNSYKLSADHTPTNRPSIMRTSFGSETLLNSGDLDQREVSWKMMDDEQAEDLAIANRLVSFS
jgi:hypothetical protein